ncbi:ribonuclease H-like domain-containing protein [Tanacetum coccineum]
MPENDDTPPPNRVGAGSSASEASKLIFGDELYLHPTDASNIPLINETYDKVNGSVTFDLHHQINTLSQNGSTLSRYYHKLNLLWKQFDALVKLPACTCDAAKDFKKHKDLIKLMQFLMGLDELYLPLRSNVLTRDPIPDVKTTFSVICREESHKGSSSSTGNKHHAYAFAARSFNEINNKAEQIHQLLNLLNSSKNSNNAHAYMGVHKLARDSKLFIAFDEHKCYIHDLQARKTLRTRSQREGRSSAEHTVDNRSISNSEATHDEDSTEPLDNVHNSFDSDSGATQEDHTLLYQIDNNIVEPSSTSEVVTGNNLDEVNKVKEFLKNNFMIKDLGELKYFLGIEIIKTNDGICLSQRKYCLEILSEYGLLAYKPSQAPIESKLIIGGKPINTKDKPLKNITEYQKLLGKLIYLTHTKPDISYAVYSLSKFMHSPLESHLKLGLRILRLSAEAQGDLSSVEAEYRVLASATCEVIWLTNLLQELNVKTPKPITMCNKAAIF